MLAQFYLLIYLCLIFICIIINLTVVFIIVFFKSYLLLDILFNFICV